MLGSVLVFSCPCVILLFYFVLIFICLGILENLLGLVLTITGSLDLFPVLFFFLAISSLLVVV